MLSLQRNIISFFDDYYMFLHYNFLSRLASLITLCLMTWGSLLAQSRHYSVLSLGVADGLSSTITFDAVLGNDDFLWISTDQGVDRFDGHSFKHYSLSASDIKRRDDGSQYHLLRDNRGRLICFSDKGKVSCYNADADRFDELYNAKEILHGHSLYAMALDGDQLLLCVHNGVYIVDLQHNGAYSHLAVPNHTYCIKPFTPGTYLVGSEQGVECLDLAQKRIYTLTSLRAAVKSLYYDPEQRKVWIGTNGSGLWSFLQDTGEITQMQSWNHSIINNISPYGNSQLAVATDGDGILRMSRIYNSPLLQVANDLPDATLELPVAGVQSLLVDGQNVWVCTWGGGISLLYRGARAERVEHPNPQVLSEKRANDISVDQEGNIWVAFNRAIVRFDHATREAETFLSTSQASLLTVLCASDGTIWCGGYNTGLYHLDPVTKKTFHLPSVTGGVVNNSVYALCEDHLGRIWVAGLNMPLSCITPSSHLGVTQQEIKNYGYSVVNDMVLLNDTVLAAATVSGILLLNMESGQERTILDEADSLLWQGTAYMPALDCDDQGNLVVATEGSGLIIYNTQTQSLANFNSTHGLPSNYISSVEVINDSLYWIGTSGRGIFSFNPHTGQVIEQYNRNNGLASEEFYRHSSALDHDGHVFFGGRESVEIVSVQSSRRQDHDQHILLTSVGLGQENNLNYQTHPHIIEEPLATASLIHLPYGERSLRLSFGINDLYHQSGYRFQYKLNDTDHLWQSMDAQRTLTFYTLPPGKHHLTVRCLDGYGVVAERQLVIDALQTPWLQWPALLCYLMLLLIPVAVAIVAYLKHMAGAAAEEKIRFFNSVAHDIRTPLSLVSTPLADLEQYISPDAPPTLLPLIKRNLQHLVDVVSQLSLFNSDKQGVQHLQLEPILLNDFVNSLAENYAPIVKRSGLEFNLSIPEQAIWVKGDLKALMRVCDNLMGNSLKFTKQGSISVSVKLSGRYGVIEVADTGLGMTDDVKKRLFKHFFRGQNALDSAIPGFGLGLMYSYQVCQRMQGTMTCQSQEGQGSTLGVLLPQSEPGQHQHSYQLQDMSQYLPAIESEGKALYSSLRYDVLLVEDNPDLLEYLREKLSKGYNVSCARSVDEARLLMKEHTFNLIISDIMMPGMRGDEWCQELKADIETSHIPVILLTAATHHEQRLHGLAIGADDYITKPFDTNVLLAKVRNIFDSRRKMHAHYLRVLQKEKPKANPSEPKTIQAQTQAMGNLDEEFINRLMKVIDKYIAQSDLSVDDLAREMAMSHTLFYERVNKLMGMPPASLIRSCRMQHAKALLLEHKYSISEVAMQCGFADAKNFSTAFKKFYGVPPSKIE